MIRKRHSANKNKVIVTFEIPATIWTERINLVGDFNNWDRESLPFRRDREGNWEIEIELDVGHQYRFCYLLDGDHWRHDLHADKYAINPHGGYDSIVVAQVPHSPKSPNRLQGEVERASLSLDTFRPNTPAVALDDMFGDGQP